MSAPTTLKKIKYTANKYPVIKSVGRQPVVLYRKVRSYPRAKKMYERTITALPDYSRTEPVIWYFCEAEHRNLGDLAQRLCIENWLSENFPGMKVYQIPTKAFNTFKKEMLHTLKQQIQKEDLIVFQSGYTMTGIHPDDRLRAALLPYFPDNRILIFPQTILYDNQKLQDSVYHGLKGCRDLLLLTRDQTSAELSARIFPEIRTELYPDIVTTLIGQLDFSETERSGIGLCVRDDGEKYYSFEEINGLRDRLSVLDSVDVTDTDCRNLPVINSNTIRKAVMDKIAAFARKKLIITDRYHGTIFSLIAGTPVIVIKTRDHKVSTGVQWFNGIYDSNVCYCENLNDVPALAERWYNRDEYPALQPYFKREFYDRLKELFLGADCAAYDPYLKNDSNGICKNADCTGCMACMNTCPHGAISCGTDERGFYIPVIDTQKCINCGLCRKICPSRTSVNRNEQNPDVWAAWSRSPELRAKSTSGGIFTGIAEYVLSQNGHIYGCALNQDHVAEHICIDSVEALEQLRGSKYVQSRIGTCYRDVKKDLKEGRTVLFTGTPCQIAGLKASLGKTDCSNLYTMDIICHGVPSPKAFADYMAASEKETGARAEHISFRHKQPGWTNFSMHLQYSNGKEYTKEGRFDPYEGAFLKDFLTRSCCHNCQYTSTARMGDITAGDFWSYVSTSKEWKNDEKGISLVLVNNEKGRQIFEAVKNDYMVQERTIAEAKRGNRCLSRPYTAAPGKENFWNDYLQTGDLLHASGKYVPMKKASFKHQVSEELNRNYYRLPAPAKKTLRKHFHI